MKQIKLISNLGESETLIELKKISDKLLKLGKISRGDEIVIESGYEDEKPTFTLDAALLGDNLKLVKPDLEKIGKLIESKHFDEPATENKDKNKTPNSPDDTSKPAEGDDKQKREESILNNNVKPAVTLHDTSELLFDLGDNQNSNNMSEIKDLLFSEDELQAKVINFDDLKFTEEEINPAKTISFDDLLFSNEEIEADTVEEPSREMKSFDDLLFSDDEMYQSETKTFDDLLFSDDEMSQPEEKTFDDLLFSDDEMYQSETKTFDDLLFSDEELNNPTTQEFDNTPECPIDKEKAGAKIKEFCKMYDEGKELSIDQKYFCDSMKKYFTAEELKQFCGDSKLFEDSKPAATEESKPASESKEDTPKTKDEPKKEDAPKSDPKPKEEPKKEDAPKETRDELIRRLNKEHESKTLLGAAKAAQGKIK